MTTALTARVPTVPTTAVPTTAAPALVALLEDALSLIAADDDLDRYEARTPAGSALMSLSAIARRTAAVLGTAPGTHLTDGPGVVVVRDLAAATRLLVRAVDAATHEDDRTASLAASARGVHATLRELLTAAG